MLSDSCGRIFHVDSEAELPDPLPENNIYFTKDTKEIIGNMGGG
jgi:hypothetical protein